MSASKAVSAVPERPAVMGRYKPYWTETPDSGDMSSFYPAHAQRHDINGRATLRCQVGPDGRLNACQVRAEAPQGEGFGAAALSLSEKFRMLPPDIPAGHAPPEITIPIVFEIPNYNRSTKVAAAKIVDSKALEAWAANAVAKMGGATPIAIGGTALAVLVVLMLVLGRTRQRGRSL